MNTIKRFFLLFTCLTVFSMSMSADGLTKSQKKLRDEIMQYFAVEGIYAETDQNGRIVFYYENSEYYIGIDTGFETPMMLCLYKTYSYSPDYNRDIHIMASAEVNSSHRGVKLIFLKDTYRIQSEYLLYNAENFKYSFKKIMEEMMGAEKDMEDACASSSTLSPSLEIPFIALEVKIGNFDKDNNMISDFGEPIYANKAMYLKQRVSLTLLKGAGTYNLGIRFYKDDKLVKNDMSANGYSYELPIDIGEKMLQTIYFPGWGDDRGFWDKGSYRYEIWSGDYCVGSCSFMVK